jgi:hypothetical protein
MFIHSQKMTEILEQFGYQASHGFGRSGRDPAFNFNEINHFLEIIEIRPVISANVIDRAAPGGNTTLSIDTFIPNPYNERFNVVFQWTFPVKTKCRFSPAS